MLSYSNYKTYKPSPSLWMGDIPEHWVCVPLKHIATFVNGYVFPPNSWTESGVPIIRIENLNGGDRFNYCDGNVDERHHVNRGALLFGWSGNRGTSFGPFRWSKDGLYYLNQHIFKVVGDDCDADWLYWCLRAVTSHVEEMASGIIGMVHITKGELGSTNVCVPPLEEQQAIARFLDFKTAQIDALIAKKKALLDKLAEKRTALISHAVTKGLDPSVAMKDSKVEWLGSIPQDWKETRVKFLGDLILGLTYSPDDVVSDGGTLVLRSSNVQEGKISLDDCVYVSCNIPKKVITKADDILICSRNGSRTLIGKCALLTEEVSNQAFGAFMTVLRSRHARFLYYVLNSTLFKFQSGRFLTSTINQLTTQTLGDFEIALPPEETQAEIVNHLDKATAAIDAQCRKAQIVIDRLTEYRGALITNAVTGKIDVRDFAIPQIAEGLAS